MEILSNDDFMLHCVFLSHVSPLIFQCVCERYGGSGVFQAHANLACTVALDIWYLRMAHNCMNEVRGALSHNRSLLCSIGP